MANFIYIVAISTALLPAPAVAGDLRELGRAEIRQINSSDLYLGQSALVSLVDGMNIGEILDIRVFESDGIYYRILVIMPDGKIGSIVLDARTGKPLQASSSTAQEIRSMAQSRPGKGFQPNAGVGNGRGGANGQGNGAENGNSGGNGKGNGSGKGNGKGSGNGKGKGKGNK